MPPKTLVAFLLAIAALPARAQHAHDMMMQGALGPYAMSREASGTSWQPDDTPMEGFHTMAGDWMFMVHGYADLVYDRQGGDRGGEKVFVPSMFMAMGQRQAGPGTWAVRTMLSIDPFMGRSGYPLLFQTGETADGVEPLVDRQHPHDLFMELATAYSVPVGPDGKGSVFGYAGLPGEPALGPPAFMHRASGMPIPEAPLSHHWLDSTHVTFGVVTLGAIWREWKLEGSVFNGREPDQFRWNIETAPLDSWSARLSFNPTEHWSMQVSHGRLEEPEQLEPGVDVERTTASVSHSASLDDGHWSTTLAYGVNRIEGETNPAYLLESTRDFAGRYALFGRAEWLNNDELLAGGPPGGLDAGKLSLGGSYRIASLGEIGFDAGALVSVYRVPSEAEAAYGSNPVSGMVFVRAHVD